MNFMRILGLILIGVCIATILAAVIIGDRVSLFVAALVLGIAGNVLYWLGKPKYILDEEESTERPTKDKEPCGQPPAS